MTIRVPSKWGNNRQGWQVLHVFTTFITVNQTKSNCTTVFVILRLAFLCFLNWFLKNANWGEVSNNSNVSFTSSTDLALLLIFSSLHISTWEIEFPKNLLLSLFCSCCALTIGISPSSDFKNSSASTPFLLFGHKLTHVDQFLHHQRAHYFHYFCLFTFFWEDYWNLLRNLQFFCGGLFINLFLNFLIDSPTRLIISSLLRKLSDSSSAFVTHKVLKALLWSNFTVSIDYSVTVWYLLWMVWKFLKH